MISFSFVLFFIIQYDKNFIVKFFNYLNWLKYFLIGDFGITLGGNKNITLFNFSIELSTIAIGPEYLHTVFLTIISIIISFLVSLSLNFMIIIKKNNILIYIKEIIEWFSNIHILIIGIIMYSIFFDNITYLLGIIMICLGSTAFSQLSTLQFSDMKELNNKDYIIAARAWGDSVWKHMKRGFALNSINQLLSLWLIFFSNTMIFEIICQKPGLGYLLFKYFLDSKQSLLIQSNSSYLPEPDLFLAISMKLTLFVSTSAKYLSPSLGGRIGPSSVSPFLRPYFFI